MSRRRLSISAAPIPDQEGAPLAWSLGDIPPMTSKTAVLTVSGAATVTEFTDLDGGAAAWHPEEQTVDGVLFASFTLVITNTGNLNTEFQISGSVTAGGKVSFGTHALEIPARGTAALPALVEVPQGGVYQVSATAQSGQAQDSASATLTVILPASRLGINCR